MDSLSLLRLGFEEAAKMLLWHCDESIEVTSRVKKKRTSKVNTLERESRGTGVYEYRLVQRP